MARAAGGGVSDVTVTVRGLATELWATVTSPAAPAWDPGQIDNCVQHARLCQQHTVTAHCDAKPCESSSAYTFRTHELETLRNLNCETFRDLVKTWLREILRNLLILAKRYLRNVALKKHHDHDAFRTCETLRTCAMIYAIQKQFQLEWSVNCCVIICRCLHPPFLMSYIVYGSLWLAIPVLQTVKQCCPFSESSRDNFNLDSTRQAGQVTSKERNTWEIHCTMHIHF